MNRFSRYALLASPLLLAAPASHAVLSLANAPLFLTINIAPNLILTLDDSGSMARAYTPDALRDSAALINGPRFKAASVNTMYYNPRVNYTIPKRRDGISYSTSFTSAPIDGFNDGITSGKQDLSTNYRVTFEYYGEGAGQCSNYVSSDKPTPYNCWLARNPSQDFSKNDTEESGTAAYYYLYYQDRPNESKPNGCTSPDRATDACYVKIDVGGKKDIAAGNSASQKQNFANWYSFYRTRALAVMSSAMSAVNELNDDDVRLGWQTLNNGDCNSFGTSCKGYGSSTTYDNRVRRLTTGRRSDFFNWLQRFDIYGGTPLRGALKRVGEYLSSSSTDAGKDTPYAEDPYVSQGTELSCRKNFHILFTDGMWNQNNKEDFGGNLDSTGRTLPDGKVFPAGKSPYKDSNSNSLADIAFKYWATDLHTGLDNKVASNYLERSGTADEQYWNPKNDPASWQHLVNFTIGLGLSNTLTDSPKWGGSSYTGDYGALLAGTLQWPAINEAPKSNEEPVAHVYDLWHAAINSRGQFFSADNPDAVVQAFRTAIRSVLDANPSASALTTNSTSIQVGSTVLFQARFDSKDWHGQLLALPMQADGSHGGALWDAGTLIPVASSRKLFTIDAGSGKALSTCAQLSTAQKLALNTARNGTVDNQCDARLAWLRGDASKEVRNSGTLRNRPSSVLGDIINSDPLYKLPIDEGYKTPAIAEASSYAAFVAAKSSRVPAVFVGANDGMLHAFRADLGNLNAGAELFGFVPNGVFDQLSSLTDPAYSHRYSVDGSPTVGDAYLNGNWKSVLLAGLNSGGKSIYALDVTNPDAFDASKVLWEYSDTDLGYTYSQPQLARLATGQWAAIFGNGYNSTADKAYLYVVNLANGTLIKKIPAGSATANGLSTPVLYDTNGDRIVDAAYAGDLQGQLWKFDLSGNNASSWGVGNSGQPLFVALRATNSG